MSDVSADAPSGVVDLGTIDGKLGFNRIVAVLETTVRTPGTPDTMRSLQGIWHPASQTLTLCETAAYVMDPADPDGGSDLADGDVLRLVLIGV
jgi:hypothetical protein